MWRPLSDFLRAGDWPPAAGCSQPARGEGPEARPRRPSAGVQVGGGRRAASGQAGRAGTRGAAGLPRGRASMWGDRAARWPALSPPPPPPMLLLLLLLSGATALHPGELFPYGQARGDQLLQEGDDESSAAVTLASPLRFYEARFSYLYVSAASSGVGSGGRRISRSFLLGVVWLPPYPGPRMRAQSPHARLSRSDPGGGTWLCSGAAARPAACPCLEGETVRGHLSVPVRKERS